MDFETISEPFSIYTLPDGRRMRVKHILTEVTQTGVDTDGHPMWNVQFTPVIAIEPTPEQNTRIIEQARKAQEQSLNEPWKQDGLWPSKKDHMQ